MVSALPLELLLFPLRPSRPAFCFYFFVCFFHSGIPFLFIFALDSMLTHSLAFPDGKFVLQKGLFYFLLP